MLARLAVVLAACSPGPVAGPHVLAHATTTGRGLVVAVRVDDKLALARVDGHGVKVLAEIGQVDAFGWLDDRTLMTLAQDSDDKPFVVQRVVDARVVETFQLPADKDSKHATLVLTTTHEAYLSACEDDGNQPEGCAKVKYLRIYPARDRAWQYSEPAGYAPERTRIASADLYDREPRPTPVTMAPPTNVDLQVYSKTIAINGIHAAQPGVGCHRGATTTFFPDDAVAQGMYPEVVMGAQVRWVQTDPPIYEVYANLSGPQMDGPYRFYLRACEREPLDAYAQLGDGLWGSFGEDERRNGTWTFWHGRERLGTLAGSAALLANR